MAGDLGADPNDITMFIVSWQIGATSVMQITKEEFIEGLTALRCDNMQKIKEKIPGWRAELNDNQTFKEFYQFLFDFGRSANQKSLGKHL
jgi:hypothetical protein